MKRLDVRGIVLLCSPIAVIAGAAWLMRVLPRKPSEDKLYLSFHRETPTALEAFSGADAAAVVEIKGPNTQPGAGLGPLRVWQSSHRLELKTPQGTQVSRSDGASWNRWGNVWKGGLNNSRFVLDLSRVPPGQLFFAVDAQLSPMSSPPAPGAARLSGKWKVERAKIKPFRFRRISRAPLITLRSASILRRNPGNIQGEVIFDLPGASMSEQTLLNLQFTGGGVNSWGTGSSGGTTPTALRRVIEWTAANPGFGYPSAKPTVRITGRASGDNHWPLAFAIEPFDFSKVRVGQHLNVRSWPAPLPR
jgi:hypothetical protein